MIRKENKNNSKNQKYLPVSCLGSVYKASTVKEVKLSLESLIYKKSIPNEIIIVIDGIISNKLLDYLNKFKKTSKCITKLVFNNKNFGTGIALRKGLDYCKNKIIIRFDSDDISLPYRVKETYEFMINNPKTDILNTSIIEFIPSEKSILVNAYLRKISSNADIQKIINFRNPINHPSIAFRKKAIIEIGSYSDMKFFEDYFLWIKAIKNNIEFSNLEKPMVLMKRENLSKRRSGFRLAIYDIRFVLSVLKYGYFNPIFYFSSLIRITIKLIPKLHYYFSLMVSWRSKKFKVKNPYLNAIGKYDIEYIDELILKL